MPVARATHLEPARSSVAADIRLHSGSACPTCFSTIYYKKYTFWHILIAICTFPFGLLFFFAPVRVCENGHKYGLGSWIVGIIQGTLVLAAVLIGVLYGVYNQRRDISRDFTTPLAVATDVSAPTEQSSPAAMASDPTEQPSPAAMASDPAEQPSPAAMASDPTERPSPAAMASDPTEQSSPEAMASDPAEQPSPAAMASAPVAAAPVDPSQSATLSEPSAGLSNAAFVSRYYTLWNQRNYRTMYAMLSARMQNKYPYEAYVQAHQAVQHIEAVTSPGSSPEAVDLRITSAYREKDGSLTESINDGTWLLANVGGVRRLDHEDVHEFKPVANDTPAPASIAEPTPVSVNRVPASVESPAASAGQQETVSCDKPNDEAQTVTAVQPDTPPDAQQQGITGVVNVIVRLDADSQVVGTPVVQSSPSQLLNDAAVKAAERSTFRTEIRDCKPIAATYVFAVKFSNN